MKNNPIRTSAVSRRVTCDDQVLSLPLKLQDEAGCFIPYRHKLHCVKLATGRDLNPVHDVEIYGSASIKYSYTIGDVKLSSPLIGYQLGASYQGGARGEWMSLYSGYGSKKISKKPDIDARVYPAPSLSQEENGPLLDWNSSVRVMTTIAKTDLCVPIPGLPGVKIPVADAKGQVESSFMLQKQQVRLGVRGAVETKPIGGVTFEVALGGRVTFKMPDIFKD